MKNSILPFLILSQIVMAIDHTSTSDRITHTDLSNKKYLQTCGKPVSDTKKSQALDSTTQAAYGLLRNRCAECHHNQSSTGAATFKDILDVPSLLSAPPNGPKLSAEEINIFSEWIKKGTSSFTITSQFAEIGPVSEADSLWRLLEE